MFEVFQKVIRIHGKSQIYDLNVICDINRDLFTVKKDSVLQFEIQYDKTEKFNIYNPKEDEEEEMFKGWDYVTHGTVFEIKEKDNDQLQIKKTCWNIIWWIIIRFRRQEYSFKQNTK